MLELRNISKSYGAFSALKSVSLSVHSGEIHGLIGANGSGKSTLLNILSGQKIIQETGGFGGELWFENKRRRFASPRHAIQSGIGMVHQEFVLIPHLSVAENISLSGEKTVGFSQKLLGHDLACINKRANRAHALGILQSMGIDLDPDFHIGSLSVSMKQFVEMAREFNRDPLKLLLLDEPTAALGKDDAMRLMEAVKEIASKGTAVLYVSHRLEEIVSICDRTTVLRNGEVVCNVGKEQNSMRTLSNLMVGEKVRKTTRSPARMVKEPALKLSAFSVEKPGDDIEYVDLTILKGEILGITSLSGHGRTALAPGIMGLYPVKGTVTLYDKTVNKLEPSRMIQNNIWMLPEDRNTEGLLLDQSIMDNITFTAIQTQKKFVQKTPFPLISFPDLKKCKTYTEKCIKAFDINCKSVFQKVRELSGGNQQKVCIAGALSMKLDILFINDPTRGIDIAAKESILGLLIRAHATHGMTLVISSGELDELRRICDRIAVFFRGRLFDVLSPERKEEDIVLACSGIRTEES